MTANCVGEPTRFAGLAPRFGVIDNVTNLLSGDWGVNDEPHFSCDVTQSDIDAGCPESRIEGASLWEIRIGVE